MKFLSIDPSSTILGWAIFETTKDPVHTKVVESELLDYGDIDARKVEYAQRFLFISGAIHDIWRRHEFEEIAMEETFIGDSKIRANTAALKVAETTIRKWAEGMTLRGTPISVRKYHPSTWKSAVVGNGNAKKDEIERVIWLHFRDRFNQDKKHLNEHIIDAIAIGIYHAGIIRWEGLKSTGDR